MNTSFAQGTLRPVQRDDVDYASLLATATAPLEGEFATGIHVDVDRMDRLGNWIFVMGTMKAEDGGRPAYAATRYAEKKWGKRLSVEKGHILFQSEREKEFPAPALPQRQKGLSR